MSKINMTRYIDRDLKAWLCREAAERKNRELPVRTLDQITEAAIRSWMKRNAITEE